MSLPTMTDHQFERAFLEKVLAPFPDRDLMEDRDGVRVELVSNAVLYQVENLKTDREFFTYGRWYGKVTVGDDSRWAVWSVDDDDEADEEADDRGRSVTLFGTEAEAAEHFTNDLIYTCGIDDDRPNPEDWPNDQAERDWQTQRLAEYIRAFTPYWQALTGLPEDVIAYCINARQDPRSIWESTRGNPTPDEVAAFRMLAAFPS